MFIRWTTSIVADSWIGCSSHIAAVAKADRIGFGARRLQLRAPDVRARTNINTPTSRCRSRLSRLKASGEVGQAESSMRKLSAASGRPGIAVEGRQVLTDVRQVQHAGHVCEVLQVGKVVEDERPVDGRPENRQGRQQQRNEGGCRQDFPAIEVQASRRCLDSLQGRLHRCVESLRQKKAPVAGGFFIEGCYAINGTAKADTCPGQWCPQHRWCSPTSRCHR